MKKFLMTLLSATMVFTGCYGPTDAKLKNISLESVVFDDQTYPVVILGGGVAGLTAALYFSQANIPCLVIEGPKPGGALSQSHSVRNWPGVQDAPGKTIVDGIAQHVEKNGVQIVEEKVINVDLKQWPRVIETQRLDDSSVRRQIKALSVVIALGTEPYYLNVPGETGDAGYWGRGVSNCAVCEGSLYKDKRVVVVGGGDAAVTEADYLADIAREVIMLVRKPAFKAKDIKAREKVMARRNVKVLFNTHIQTIHGDDEKVTEVVTLDSKHKNQSTLPVDAVFLAIGSRPNTYLFKDQLTCDEQGFITLANHQETSLPGVYAVGDVCDGQFVQAITAAGDGCKAALQGIKFLKDLGYQGVASKAEVNEAEEPTAAEEAPEEDEEIVADNNGHRVREIKTVADFEKYVLNARKPVVLDLFTTWCIPCQKMMPVVDKLAEHFDKSVSFVKCNLSSPDLAVDQIIKKLGGAAVRSVPTFIFVNRGKETSRIVGSLEFERFKQQIVTTCKVAA